MEERRLGVSRSTKSIYAGANYSARVCVPCFSYVDDGGISANLDTFLHLHVDKDEGGDEHSTHISHFCPLNGGPCSRSVRTDGEHVDSHAERDGPLQSRIGMAKWKFC